MKVVYPWALNYPEARRALKRAAPHFDEVDVRHSEYDYARLIEWLWRNGEPFILVEHDIVVRPGTIDELERCERDWCAFPYPEEPLPSDPVTGLGCTKFGARVLRTVKLWSAPLPWQSVDAGIGGRVRAAGFVAHIHVPPLVHLNPRLT